MSTTADDSNIQIPKQMNNREYTGNIEIVKNSINVSDILGFKAVTLIFEIQKKAKFDLILNLFS